jgi:hypothetical protein
MKKTFTRRMALATLSLALLGAAGAQAQTAYPSQPIKFIVPYPAGGTTDVLARMVAQKMQESWQQTVVVENKPGAGGTIGNNLVAKAPADGYTVLFGIVALVQQMTLMKLPYDPIKDFAPISRVAITPAVFAASTTLPVNNLRQVQLWHLRPRHFGPPARRAAQLADGHGLVAHPLPRRSAFGHGHVGRAVVHRLHGRRLFPSAYSQV